MFVARFFRALCLVVSVVPIALPVLVTFVLGALIENQASAADEFVNNVAGLPEYYRVRDRHFFLERMHEDVKSDLGYLDGLPVPAGANGGSPAVVKNVIAPTGAAGASLAGASEKVAVPDSTSSVDQHVSDDVESAAARARAVRNEMLHCWRGYRRSPAWGHDDVKPDTGVGSDWVGYAVQIVEGLDTMLLMDMQDEVREGLDYLLTKLEPAKRSNGPMTTFEVVIRPLGGLISAAQLLQEERRSLLAGTEQRVSEPSEGAGLSPAGGGEGIMSAGTVDRTPIKTKIEFGQQRWSERGAGSERAAKNMGQLSSEQNIRHLEKLARSIARKICGSFSGGNFPPNAVDLRTKRRLRWGGYSIAEVGSIQLEFRALTDLVATGALGGPAEVDVGDLPHGAGEITQSRATVYNRVAEDQRQMDQVLKRVLLRAEEGAVDSKGPHEIIYECTSGNHRLVKVNEFKPLLPNMVTAEGPDMSVGTVLSVSARADSYYEYLLKLALLHPNAADAPRLRKLFRDSVQKIGQYLGSLLGWIMMGVVEIVVFVDEGSQRRGFFSFIQTDFHRGCEKSAITMKMIPAVCDCNGHSTPVACAANPHFRQLILTIK